MTEIGLALNSAWQVLLLGVVLGVGLPALFAFGLRSYAAGGGNLDGGAAPNQAAKVLAYVCWAIVVIAVVVGLVALVADGFGQELTFFHNGFVSFEKKS